MKLDQTMEKENQRVDETPALGEDLLEQILSNDNVKRAWKRVKANHGACGVDGMDVDKFPEYARSHWRSIRQALREGKYRPLPVRRCFIPKSSGGQRPLGIPSVLDRVIQQAIAQILEPTFDPGFSESSFGYRPKRSAKQAVTQIQSFIREGYTVAVQVDLKSFFDEVNHDGLMTRLGRKVRDKRVLKLIGLYLRAGVEVNGVVEQTKKGVPQGGPVSCLLANIMLDDLDVELEKRGHRFARYCDDFVIMVRSIRAGKRVESNITRFVERKLKLRVNTEKSKVGHNSKCSFLGFTFYRGGRIRLTDEALERFKQKIRKLTGRSWGVSMEYRIGALNRYIKGWMNYFGISEYYSPIPELDQWIRRRIRMCLMKQWRSGRRRVKELRKLGSPVGATICVVARHRSYWALAKHSAIQMGLTNSYIHNVLGLVSIKNLWVSFHYSS